MFSFAVRAIVFDLDGVLVDSSVAVDRQWWSWLDRNGLRQRAQGVSYHGKRTVDTLRLFLDEDSAVREAAVIEAAEREDLDGVVEVPGAAALLRSLPDTAWAIATSGPLALATARLRHAGLPIPRVMVSAEDVRLGKPDPEAYALAAQRLGVAPEHALAIEDAPAGVESARAAGLQVVGLATTHSAGDLSSADAIADRLTQLSVAITNGALTRVTIE